MATNLGILHPGEMGVSIAAAALQNLPRVYWCSEGRSPATRQRAERYGLTEINTLAEFCATCELVIGVCPPHAAEVQARQLITHKFSGTYVEANALAPGKVQSIARELATAGIRCIDGGIIGLPAWKEGATWLYLSGEHSQQVAGCFRQGLLQVAILGDEIGQASALKMCFAAWNKGNTAMLTAILGAAEAHGVRQQLEHQWDVFTPGFTQKTLARMTGTARKAWRFAGEMDEIAATLQESGMPPQFFVGAAEIYRRLASFKDIADAPAVDEVLAAISNKAATSSNDS